MRASASTPWRWFLPTLLVVSASLKLLFAWIFPAFLTGDDLEVVETAARYAVGLDYHPWSLRSLFHPLVLAYPFVRAGAWAGFSSPRVITFLAACPSVAFSTVGVFLVWRLAKAWGWPETTARVAAFLYAFHRANLAYGSTPLPRPISTCLLLAAFLLVSLSPHRSLSAFFAGLLVAAACAVRFSEAVAIAPLLAVASLQRRSVRAGLEVCVGFLAGLFVFVGLFDLLTWGAPFASLRSFVRIMHTEGVVETRPEPWFWYAKRVLHWAGPIPILLALLSWRDRRARLPAGVAAVILVLMSFSPAKDVRYTQACVPFVVLVAALGWERLNDRSGWRRHLAAAALVLTLPTGLERTLTLLEDKSQSAIAAAEFIHGLTPPVRISVLEQSWAFGERLYLGNSVSLRDVFPSHPLSAGAVGSLLAGADVAALYTRDVTPDVAAALTVRGFAPCARFHRNASLAVTVYVPAGRCRGPNPGDPSPTDLRAE